MSTVAQTPVGTFANTSSATLAKAYTSNVTAGNLLVCATSWGSATATCSVAGSLNGAFTTIAGSLATNATAGFRVQLHFKVATASGAETITMTTSPSTTSRDILIFEFTGSSGTGQPDASNAATGNTTNPTSALTTIAQPGVIVAYCSTAAGTSGAGSGCTLGIAQNGDAGEYKTYAVTGSVSVPFTDTSAGQWAMAMASFIDGGGGGGVTVKQLAAMGVG